ncbi:MAG TPA: PQQ-binding-like beta-propeller repeat protein [Polyangiaceae bacterium LLY-WYZ-15_(1-7)]|nr:PQQ-binding-like beta-propeller repeat protein [Polyangiaceae bacterium LLY-WYZ-15_(1-7)]
MTIARALLAPALLLALASCGGGGGSAFGPTFPDNREADIAAVLQRLRAAPARSAPPVALGIGTERLFAVDLTSGALRWSEPVSSPVSAPHVAGPLAVLHESSGVVARDLQTGAVAFTVPDEALHLAGADGEGNLSVLALTTGGGVGARSKIVVARGGSIAWERSVGHAIGAPAVAGDLLFVPWATQNVSVLDAATGDELARLRAADTPVGHALRVDGDVYYGQRGIFRLTPSARTGSSEQAAFFAPLERDLPGSPSFLVDPYRPAPSPSSAVHKIRYVWRPAGGGETVSLEDDTLYAVFYRIVFALDPDEDAVRWVYQHDEDIVGASAQPGGLLLADQGGGYAFVGAADGLRRWSASVDAAPTAVRFAAGDFAPSGGPEGAALSLEDQLLATAQNTDARLVPARTLAVRMLRALPDPAVTGHLIALCEDARAPEAVRGEACGALARRESGEAHVLEALQRHAGFLEGTSAPPVGPLARAAVAMESEAAVPHLIAHLRDPATPASALRPLLDALKALGARAAVEPIGDFLRLYHAEARDEALADGVVAAAEALVALQGPAAEELLVEVQGDPLAPPALRGRLAEVLEALRAAGEEPESEGGEGDGDEGDGDAEAAEASEGDEPELPQRVTRRHVEAALEPVMQDIRQCLRDDERAVTGRLVIVLEGDGEVAMVSVRPRRLQGCVEPLVRRSSFPGNRRNVREQISLDLRR